MVAVGAGPDNMQDGDDEQGSQGDIGTDEGGGEDRDQDSEGGHGGLGQGGEEAGEGAGEGREDEGGEAEPSRHERGPACRSCVASRGSPVSPTLPRVSVVCHGPLSHLTYLLPLS